MKRKFIDFLNFWKIPIILLRILFWSLIPLNGFSQDSVLVTAIPTITQHVGEYESIGSYCFTAEGQWRIRDCKMDFISGFENLLFIQTDTGTVSYLGAGEGFLFNPYTHSLDIPLFSESRTLHYYANMDNPAVVAYTYTCLMESFDGAVSYWTEPVEASFPVGIPLLEKTSALEVSLGRGGILVSSDEKFSVSDILGNKIFSEKGSDWKFVPISQPGIYIVYTDYSVKKIQVY